MNLKPRISILHTFTSSLRTGMFCKLENLRSGSVGGIVTERDKVITEKLQQTKSENTFKTKSIY